MLCWMPSAVPGGFAVVMEVEKQRFIIECANMHGRAYPLCTHTLKFQKYPRYLVQCNYSGLVFYCINVTVTKGTALFN